MNALAVDNRNWTDAAPLTDQEALTRLVEYARIEAMQMGELVCAELLTAALVSLGLAAGAAAAPLGRGVDANWL